MSGHPSLAWVPDLDVALGVLTRRLAAEGVHWPEIAAAALVARGAAGVDRASWATQLLVSAALVSAVEAGEVPLPDVPASLRRACGLGM
jgi:hypothetical protein